MRQFFITVLGTVIGIFIGAFLLIIFIIGIAAAFSPKPNNDNNIVLNLDLTAPIADQSSQSALFGSSTSVVNIVRKLEQAKNDDAVKGLFIRANSYSMSPARAEEIRLAILDFKTSGKPVIAHAQGFEGTALSHYLAVSAASEIWIQETAGFAISGYRAETPFYGGIAEKFDAKPQFEQFSEYKTAANSYTKDDYTPEHRASTTALLTSLYETAVSHIAVDRELAPDEVKSLFNASPRSAESALEAGLVTKLGYYAGAREHALEISGKNSKFKAISAYEIDYNSGPVIALISGQGAIMSGKSVSPSPFTSTSTMGSDTISEAITQAADNDKVKAIIIRVDSPGGSASASDQMWDAVKRAQVKDKPVIISMAQYAASGGYYIAAPANKIVALPMTITGSIGVLGGKIVLDETFEKVGYNVEPITIGGDYAGAYSTIEGFDQSTRAKFRASMEEIYVDFTTRVAEGRNLPLERVQGEIARGRVWTGEQAIEIGLVDELGGLSRAIEVAKEAAGIDADTQVRLRGYPGEKTASQELQELLGGTAQISANLEQLSSLAEMPEVQAAIAARQSLGALSQGDASLMADLPSIK